MKKLIITSLLMISVVTVANAQFTKMGGGLTYGTGFHYNNVTTPPYEANLHRGPFAGIFLTGIYELNLPIHIAPSFTYFLPRTNKSTLATKSENTRVSAMMFDINGHYVFNSLDRFEFYGLAGLDILLAKKKNTFGSAPTITESDNALGLNLGVGTYMKITEQFDIYGEAKYIFSKYDQFMLNVGLLLNIDWMKKHENSDM